MDVTGSNYSFVYVVLGTMRTRNYAHLIKYKVGLRNRLYVSDNKISLEEIGITRDSRYPILPNEWDKHFIHDMHYRQVKKKYCVKS